eukprot:CAMPEP_0119552264 /NCGR_PEP_ID=MMETSP1352-20130426/5312_1 /TAXON_ID=265584 /ORGANISM="Stauroneis constricta, Strain CCMP1120" /LENGTH=230 /DNA_ID=CAMNT_0007598467 /DNA_START=1073 /DNA_END=1765 /DNA_ORIENTATION=-
MKLYLKAGPKGTDVGDCPFAHFVRLVLEEKKLEYDLIPTTMDTKPNWLIEHYEGKLPALEHSKECYIESNIICEYLDFFFPSDPVMKITKRMEEAEDVIGDFFPTMVRYIKKTDDNSENDSEAREDLGACLSRIEAYLQTVRDGDGDDGAADGNDEYYLCGKNVSLLDCSFIPKLYHMTVTVDEFKNGQPALGDYPLLESYFQRFSERESFAATVYPKETVIWGWNNARN